jgi:putative ABC transport system substrate-binding protein
MLDGFFVSRRVQFATLSMRYAIPMAHATRDTVEAGALMSYGTDNLDMFHQVGLYTGRVLRGSQPAEVALVRS